MAKKKLTPEQIKKIQDLEKWFDLEITKIRKKQLEILKRYHDKKSLLLQLQVLKKIIDLK